jgi:hypothetical protein
MQFLFAESNKLQYQQNNIVHLTNIRLVIINLKSIKIFI